MKAHTGAGRDSKLVHTVVVTTTNVADITKTAELLHGAETQVHADAGYTGVEKRAEKAMLKATEKVKAGVRAFVEHPFHILKNIFGHRKVRHHGLANVMIGARQARA